MIEWMRQGDVADRKGREWKGDIALVKGKELKGILDLRDKVLWEIIIDALNQIHRNSHLVNGKLIAGLLSLLDNLSLLYVTAGVTLFCLVNFYHAMFILLLVSLVLEFPCCVFICISPWVGLGYLNSGLLCSTQTSVCATFSYSHY